MLRCGQMDGCVYGMNGDNQLSGQDFIRETAGSVHRVEFSLHRGVSKNRFLGVAGVLLNRTTKNPRHTITVECYETFTNPLQVTVFGDDMWEALEAVLIIFNWSEEISRQKGHKEQKACSVYCRRNPKKGVEKGVRSMDGHWRWMSI